jgi:tRNA-2-methylthio-N6-dimethylallyladenosine synthase
MNEYDSNRIYDLVKKINYNKTKNFNEADCYVLNTCHIREKATDKVYHDIGRVKKRFKNKKKPIVIVTGCVAQAEGEILLKKERYIDAIVGPQSYHKFNNTLLEIENKKNQINTTDFDVVEKFDSLNSILNSENKVSSFLTIQEGCDKFCKFCVVPYTRGSEYSRPMEEIISECQNLVSNGAREVTLLGQNVNAYHRSGYKLSNLIDQLSKIKKLLRIRYTTSHPIDFSNDLIDTHKQNEKLMPLIHLPVQSGSDKILRNMNRKHLVKDYLNIIYKLKKINPSIKFSSDFIIGYPGETNKDFKQTLNLLEEVEFINTYSFIFSPRPGTPASKEKEIDREVAKERLMIFQQIAKDIKFKYKKDLINKNTKVLIENKVENKKNKFFGRDEYSNSVIINSNDNLIGSIEKVRILSGNQNTLFGKLTKKAVDKNFAA